MRVYQCLFFVLSLDTVPYWQPRHADNSQYGARTTVLSARKPLHMLVYAIPLQWRNRACARRPHRPCACACARDGEGGPLAAKQELARAACGVCATRATFPILALQQYIRKQHGRSARMHRHLNMNGGSAPQARLAGLAQSFAIFPYVI
jgi:hypothetical protein